MNLILGSIGNLGVEVSNELNVLVDLVGLHLVENDGVDVLASSQDLAEARLELGLHLTALFGAVDEVGQRPRLSVGFGLRCSGSSSCSSL